MEFDLDDAISAAEEATAAQYGHHVDEETGERSLTGDQLDLLGFGLEAACKLIGRQGLGLIETTEGVDALPVGSVIRDALDNVFEKRGADHRLSLRLVGSRLTLGADGITLPAAVLHAPQGEL